MKKLEILLQMNTINKTVFNKCIEVLQFCNKWNESNKDRFITHLAMALMRVEKNESVDKIDQLLLNEILSNKFYKDAEKKFSKLFGDFHIKINENEKQYILMHLINEYERK